MSKEKSVKVSLQLQEVNVRLGRSANESGHVSRGGAKARIWLMMSPEAYASRLTSFFASRFIN